MPNQTRLGSILVAAIFIGLLTSACAPIPTKETAVLNVKGKLSFPFLVLDFGSIELNIIELDGKEVNDRSVVLTHGRHSVTIEALKGPHGYLGVAPFLGKCRSQIEIDAEIGKLYEVEFKKEKESEVLRLFEKNTGSILFNTPCTPY